MNSVSPRVTVFWRPGCLSCWRLHSKLRWEAFTSNIWQRPAGAAFVRSITCGDETIPTVRIGTQSLVNPSPRRLFEVIRETPG